MHCAFDYPSSQGWLAEGHDDAINSLSAVSAAFPLRLACRYKQTGLQADQVVSCIIDEQA